MIAAAAWVGAGGEAAPRRRIPCKSDERCRNSPAGYRNFARTLPPGLPAIESPRRACHADEASVTRTEEHFRTCFEAAGLVVIGAAPQKELPRAVFPVRMWGLRAA